MHRDMVDVGRRRAPRAAAATWYGMGMIDVAKDARA